MSTGCYQGTIAPVLMKDGKVVLVKKSLCTSSFDNKEGGTISCTTDIPESVWISVDSVVTELQPNKDLPSTIKPYTIKTTDINIGRKRLYFHFFYFNPLYTLNKFNCL